MVFTANTNLPHIPGYSIIEQIYTGSRTAVYRAQPDNSHHQVVIKILQREYPSFSELVQFRNQYTIAKNLDIPGIVCPLSLEPWRNSFALVMEDSGGVSLQQYTQNRDLDWLEVLVIALQLTAILHHLIEHRVVHKDIKPANILIHPSTGIVQIIDFSISSLLPKEIQELKNPNVLEGTLAYLAPEQTGRMNRGIDYRTDFYSLGVTLYELLTGQLPFDCDDPLELVHCHIAKQPIPPHEINQNIPQIVSKIVLKLMAKNAEDRYQSALGIKYDLEKCVNQRKETGTVVEFELGKRDVSDRFIIPEKLYGREREVAQLLAAFDRITTQENNSELILVAGFSGIGKTAVVNEVHKPIVRQKGYFIKGKFDQFNRNIPFSALVQALRDLMGQLLSESDTQLQEWQEKILDAVGENGQVIIEVIPELERIIGKQPTVAELSGSAAQNRFNLLFNKFIQVFTTKEHPLVIFLDDLQWADSASLSLLKLLMSEGERGYLLIIGAYRDNEVFPAHPLMLTLDEIAKESGIISTITLSPLSEENINHLVADTLSCTSEIAKPLTNLVYQKTKGNPFFTTQFLLGLYGDELIKFNREVGHWECDISEVRQQALTDDVVEFMAGRLQKLPAETIEILKLGACIGNRFDLNTLAIVCEKSKKDTADSLWRALQEGIILPQSEVYKFFQREDFDVLYSMTDTIYPQYSFLHDRVQQAAYSLIPEDKKKQTHLQIGRFLLEKTPELPKEENLFTIVNQLNFGISLISEPREIYQLANLNLIAGKKAKKSTAYSSAAKYLNTGRQLLNIYSWEEDYSFTLDLYQESVEVAYLNTDFNEMEQLAELVHRKAKNTLDSLKVYEVQIQASMAQNQLVRAIQTGRKVLRYLDITFPEDPDFSAIQMAMAATFDNLAGRNPLELIDLPIMSDSSKLAAMRIIKVVMPCAYQAAPMLLPLLVMKQVNLSIEYGNSFLSPSAYGFFGLILCGVVEDIATGYQFGQLALRLLDCFENRYITVETIFVVNADVKHYQEPVKKTLEPLKYAYSLGLETGNLEFAALATYIYAYHSYLIGQELTELNQEIANYNQALIKLKQQNALNFNQIIQQTIINLRGESTELCKLQGSVYNEDKMLPLHHQAQDASAIYHVHFCKMILCYLLEEFEQALDQGNKAEQYLHGVTGNLVVPLFFFYSSLVQLSIYSKATLSEQENIFSKIQIYQEKMAKWASYAPMNFQHKYDLVEAEKSHLIGQKTAAIDLYDKAILGAKENKYTQEEALANELAAKFYLNWDKEKIAAGYMQEAYYCYARWGAKAKTDDLEKRYPNLLQPIIQQATQSFNPWDTLTTITQPHLSVHSSQTATQSSTTSINSTLDFAAVLKASQALSGVIELDELLCQLTQIILQNSGGDRCALILPDSNGKWHVRAISQPEETELCSQPLENNSHLPTKLIQYVKNTQEVVAIDNLNTDLPVIDEYLQLRQPKSLLCLPILNQGHLIGILYLKNCSTSGAFTPERILVLNFLCTQAAISLENARLYQQSQAYAQQLEESQLQMVQHEKMASLGNLVAGVAHEINNPLGFLNGSIGSAKDYLQDIIEHLELYQEQYPEATEDIQENAEEIDLDFLCKDIPKMLDSMEIATKRIKNISTSLRTFSRADTEHKVSTNLHEGLDSTLLILKYRLKASDVRPAIQVIKNYGELPTIECFSGQLNQVFMNIIANSIDVFDEFVQDLSYADLVANPQQITIQTSLITEQNAVEIMIGDNGKGMKPELKERIFDHLFTTKGVGKGTGLGLAIARQIIVEKHGGSLDVESDLDQGTQFFLRLPL